METIYNLTLSQYVVKNKKKPTEEVGTTCLDVCAG